VQPSVFVEANLSTEVFMTVAGAELSCPAEEVTLRRRMTDARHRPAALH
jgi:hypothetical protein